MSKVNPTPVQRALKFGVFGVLVVYLVAFSIWNATARTSLKAWFTTPADDYPALYPVLLAFLAGFLAAAFYGALGTLRRSTELRQFRRRVASLEDEIARLRNLPIEEDLGVPSLTAAAPEDS